MIRPVSNVTVFYIWANSLYCTQTLTRNLPEVTEGACGKARKTAPACKIPLRASLHSFRLKQKEKLIYQIPHCHPPQLSSFSAGNSPPSLFRCTLELNFPHIKEVLSRVTNAKLQFSHCAGDLEQLYTKYKVSPLEGEWIIPFCFCFSTTPSLHGRKMAQETLKKFKKYLYLLFLLPMFSELNGTQICWIHKWLNKKAN